MLQLGFDSIPLLVDQSIPCSFQHLLALFRSAVHLNISLKKKKKEGKESGKNVFSLYSFLKVEYIYCLNIVLFSFGFLKEEEK